jgi:hypothetical protein
MAKTWMYELTGCAAKVQISLPMTAPENQSMDTRQTIALIILAVDAVNRFNHPLDGMESELISRQSKFPRLACPGSRGLAQLYRYSN